MKHSSGSCSHFVCMMVLLTQKCSFIFFTSEQFTAILVKYSHSPLPEDSIELQIKICLPQNMFSKGMPMKCKYAQWPQFQTNFEMNEFLLSIFGCICGGRVKFQALWTELSM